MTATEIIAEIRNLPAKERAQVESFIRNDESAIRLRPEELGDLAMRLAETNDPAKADQLEDEIVSDFYGKK